MTIEYQGQLFGFFETGTEGVLWALQIEDKSGYEGLILLEKGDHLTIYSSDHTEVFNGIIKPDRSIGLKQRPGVSIFQATALGLWIHWTQEGFDPDVWATFFKDKGFTGILLREKVT